MQTLLIATTNSAKREELSTFFSSLPLHIVSLLDLSITDDIEEDGKTYEENSQKKALFYAKKSGLPTIADDGGLEIEALGGKPGIHSRRWLGFRASDEELINHMQKVAKSLADNRRASFITVVSFALPNGKVYSSKGVVKGIIAEKPLHNFLKGYPYRSFFYLPKVKKYYHEGELSKEEQKLYNHRYKAVEKLKPTIIKSLHL